MQFMLKGAVPACPEEANQRPRMHATAGPGDAYTSALTVPATPLLPPLQPLLHAIHRYDALTLGSVQAACSRGDLSIAPTQSSTCTTKSLTRSARTPHTRCMRPPATCPHHPTPHGHAEIIVDDYNTMSCMQGAPGCWGTLTAHAHPSKPPEIGHLSPHHVPNRQPHATSHTTPLPHNYQMIMGHGGALDIA